MGFSAQPVAGFALRESIMEMKWLSGFLACTYKSMSSALLLAFALFSARLSTTPSPTLHSPERHGRGALSVHMAGNAGYVRQVLSELMDLFIDEYLRVNAESCQ